MLNAASLVFATTLDRSAKKYERWLTNLFLQEPESANEFLEGMYRSESGVAAPQSRVKTRLIACTM